MQRVRFDIVDHTAHVTLNRPDTRNAFDPQMIRELTEVFRNVSRHQTLRAVCLEGEGKSFCAGADIAWMQSMASNSHAENLSDAETLHEMFAAIRACNIPVLGRVQGHVMGGGLGLISVCDFVTAASETVFCFSEVKIGLVPSVISPFVLEKANRGHAQRFMITGETFTAAQAGAMGLVHHVGTEAESKAYLVGLIAALHLNGPQAMRETKQLLRKIGGSDIGIETAKITTETIAKCRVSEEGQEGLKAFLKKRDASWKVKL
jgi:methylglutaconyl-CoA hydratase